MKKRLLLSMLLLTGVLCLTGCEEAQSKEVSSSSQEDSKELQEKDEDEQDDADSRDDQGDQDESGQDGDARDSEDGQESGQPEEDDSQEQYSPDITVYFSNEDATALDSEEIQMGSFSSENILNALVDKGVVTADVKILSLEVKEVDGKDTIEVDFNNAFGSYISSMGTSGEYYIMGGVCNTFLDAYECEQIKITVEGGILETGHAEYPGYMTKFS
ncbi:MAG: hypothetical protein HFG86_04705 [Dorea sp.]|jgi:hypothetical protein|nr:hypothetical protein [Dorea sp.]